MAARKKRLIDYVPKPGQSERELVEEHRGKDGRFEDPDFRAVSASLFHGKDLPEGHVPLDLIEWLRPKDFVAKLTNKKPEIFVEGAEANDVIQGSLGNCWFLSALCCIASRKDLIRNLFASTEYASQGIYTIRFFKNGHWKHITIDDRIPCNVGTGLPLYARSQAPEEIWVMLLEKAYAKMNGRCYRNLETGTMTMALKDLTGGDPQVVDLNDPQVRDECANGFLWQKLKLWMKQGSLCGCCYSLPRGQKREVAFDGGIIRGHAYGIIDVREHKDLRFLQVRNPWGMKEWCGPWADYAPEWQNLDADAPQWMRDYVPANDGMFWMLFEDWCRYFNTLYVCILFPSSWSEELVKGRWDAGINSGGCPGKKNEWWTNPCYRLTVTTRTQVFVTMSQKDMRMYGNRPDETQYETTWNKYNQAIGFVVSTERAVARCKRLHAVGAESRLPRVAQLGRSVSFKRDRDVSLHTYPLVLEPSAGPFVLIPMTYEPKVDGKYFLTVRSNKPVKIEEFQVSGEAAEDEDEEDLEEEEEGEAEADNELLQLPAVADEDFQEKRVRLRLSQAEVVALCGKGVPCEPWVHKDTDQGLKFEDPAFKAEERSIFIDPKAPGGAIELEQGMSPADITWVRPAQLAADGKDPKGARVKPRLFKDAAPSAGVNGGVVQGALSDSWFLGALAVLATRPEMLRGLFVNYSAACEACGVYTCRFYKDGKWHEVMVDDQLPCTKRGRALLARCAEPGELWVPILEKAYAKLHGCYECLAHGNLAYALKDLTGGAPQILRLSDPDVESRVRNGMLWKEMSLLITNGSLIGSAIKSDTGRRDNSAETGLLPGHCYPLVALRELHLPRIGERMYEGKTVLRLLKLKNPWGKAGWVGPWSQGAKEWTTYPRVAEELAGERGDETFFWMWEQDFYDNLNTLYVCRMFKEPWQCTRSKGKWLREDLTLPVPRPSTAMGAPSSKNPSAWLQNPQFLLYVEQKTSCFIYLSQHDTRVRSDTKDWKPNHYRNAIGFVVVKAAALEAKGARARTSDLVAMSGFRRDRDVATPFTLNLNPKDSPYVVIPMTFEPEKEGGFMLNIWHKSPVLVRGGERVRVVEVPAEAVEEQDEWGDMAPEDKFPDDDAIQGDTGGRAARGGDEERTADAAPAVGASSAARAPAGAATSAGAEGAGASGDLASALVTLVTELGPKLNPEQRKALAEALGVA